MWNKYNDIDFDEFDDCDGYRLLCVSVFDHVLSHGEAVDFKAICYVSAVDFEVVGEYLQLEEKIINLMFYLYNKNGCGFSRYENQDEVCEIKSGRRFKRLISLALKERYRCMGAIVFNRIGVVVEFGFDLTHNFYLHNSSKIYDSFEAIVQRCGLFVLGELPRVS